jgi:hypothetical protein
MLQFTGLGSALVLPLEIKCNCPDRTARLNKRWYGHCDGCYFQSLFAGGPAVVKSPATILQFSMLKVDVLMTSGKLYIDFLPNTFVMIKPCD